MVAMPISGNGIDIQGNIPMGIPIGQPYGGGNIQPSMLSGYPQQDPNSMFITTTFFLFFCLELTTATIIQIDISPIMGAFSDGPCDCFTDVGSCW
jgi:hypothetical protein